MGCIKSKTGGSTHQVGPMKAPGKRFTISYSKSPEPAVSLLTPGLVQHLSITNDPSVPSICFSWEPPANMIELGEQVLQYDIKISSFSSSKGGEVTFDKEIEVEGVTTMIELTSEHGLKPLCGYNFGVRAKSTRFATGEWNAIEGFMDWLCRLPGCSRNRLALEDGSIYKYCSREHKIEYDEGYCLYPDCNNPVVAPSPPSTPSTPASPSSVTSAMSVVLTRDAEHFCTPEHFELTLRRKTFEQPGAFYLKVDPSTQEFRTVEALFQKRWTSKDKKCPALTLVLAVLHPSLNKKFNEYAESHAALKDKKEHIKTFYFGTTLGCDLHTYQDPCSNSSSFSKCGICNLSCEGFSKIVAPMIPLDKSPSDAHLKTEPHVDSYTYALLMCDVVSGHAKRMSRKVSDRSRPEGTDVVGVRTNSIIGGHTETIRIYNADAVCPRYVLIYV